MIIIFDLHGVIFDYEVRQNNYDVFVLNSGLEILQACAQQKDAFGKKKHTLYILSNWGLKGFEKIKQQYAHILELFDGYVISGECGYSKPDSEIFEVLINRYQLAGENCIFIDDAAMNVAAVEKFGWTGICYEDPEHVITKLKNLKII